MNKHKWEEVFAQTIFYCIGIYIFIRLFIPIINPVKTAADLKYNQSNLYRQMLNKSASAIEVVDNSFEDEDKKNLFPLIFKYLTNIDLSNPKTYLASQIPILQLIDITSIISNDSGPVVVIPRDGAEPLIDSTTPTPTDSNPQGNNSQGNNPAGTKVNPNDTSSVPKKNLNPSKPLVLIFHTHTTEAYNPNDVNGGNFSNDLVNGVCDVGKALESELENTYGISTIHDMTIHDVPSREGGYTKARPTIQKLLKKYPSVKIVIDLHRNGGLTKNSSTAIIKNVTYARPMFVIGTKNKNVSKNKAFAKKLDDTLNNLYPGFSKGLYYSNTIYNEDLFSNMALIEIGSDVNSLDEALRTAKIMAKVFALSLK